MSGYNCLYFDAFTRIVKPFNLSSALLVVYAIDEPQLTQGNANASNLVENLTGPLPFLRRNL